MKLYFYIFILIFSLHSNQSLSSSYWSLLETPLKIISLLVETASDIPPLKSSDNYIESHAYENYGELNKPENHTLNIKEEENFDDDFYIVTKEEIYENLFYHKNTIDKINKPEHYALNTKKEKNGSQFKIDFKRAGDPDNKQKVYINGKDYTDIIDKDEVLDGLLSEYPALKNAHQGTIFGLSAYPEVDLNVHKSKLVIVDGISDKRFENKNYRKIDINTANNTVTSTYTTELMLDNHRIDGFTLIETNNFETMEHIKHIYKPL